MSEQCGTPAYIAPEIIREAGYQGFGVDIWSAGVVLFAMLYGKVPFQAGSMSELHQLILRGKYNLKDDISVEARDLIAKILQSDPSLRLTESDIMNHVWMSDIESSMDMFSHEEKDYIDREFAYTRKMKSQSNNDTDSDFFTELNIDTTQNELLKNATTRSAILAPFNSTKSNINMRESIEEKDLAKGKLIKFKPDVKDLDRQYEKNNNCELDNGVYNKMMCESSTAKNNDGTFDLLDSFKGYKSPDAAKKESAVSIERKGMPEQPHIKIEINYDIVDMVVSYGYDRMYVVECLQSNVCNHATASYYLHLLS